MSKTAGIVFGSGIVVILAVVIGYAIHTRSVAAQPKCTPGAGELCANDAFYADYERWKELRKELADEQSSAKNRALQDKQDLFNGMTTRLNQSMPSGYGWDENKLKFTKLPEPPKPPAPPASAVPATPPTK